MEIKDLEARQGNVDITVEVVSIEPPREFQKFGSQGRVANALIKDGSGDMKLTLWNEQIDQVKPGLKIRIQKGYVNEWQGEKQLTTGKFGTLEVVENSAQETRAHKSVEEPSVKSESSEEKSSEPEEKLEEGIEDIDEEAVI